MLAIYYVLIAIGIVDFFIVLFFAWSIVKGAPWSPTSSEKVLSMLNMADIKENELVYDLGCGDGRVLITAAQKFKARAVGVEIDPIRYLWCKTRIKLLGLSDRIQVILGDLFNVDLRDADVIICYLMQKTNDNLQQKLQSELKENARVISNRFVFSDLNLTDKDESLRIYAYNIEITNK